MSVRVGPIVKYLVLTGYFLALLIAYSRVDSSGLFNLPIYTFEFSWARFTFALLLLVTTASVIPAATTKVSDYFIWLHAAFPVIPTLVFFSYSGATPQFLLLLMTAFFLIRGVVVCLPRLRLREIRQAVKPPHIWILVGLCFIGIVVGGDYAAIDYSWANLYQNRAEIRDAQPYIFEYTHTQLAKSLLPFLLALYLARRSWGMMLIVLVASIAVFFLSQHRATLFFPMLVVLCYEATRRFSTRGGAVIIASLIAVIAFGLLLLLNEWTVVIGDLALRRAFFLPAILNYEYFEFFRDRSFNLFSDSKVSLGLLAARYPDPVPILIGHSIELPGSYANSSYIGSGYAQGGVFVVLGYAIAIGLILKWLDAVGDLIGSHPFAFASCSAPLFWLINSSDLPAVLLTHGLLLSLGLSWSGAAYLRNQDDRRAEAPSARPVANREPSRSPATPPPKM